MANAYGTGKVIGSADIKKQEKNVGDCRVSSTVYKIGTPKGGLGETTFLLKGEKKRNAYNDKFLQEYGSSPGQQVIMTETAFMTIDAWEKITSMFIRGYQRFNKYVKANSQRWCLQILDGFGAHFGSHYAMQKPKKTGSYR